MRPPALVSAIGGDERAVPADRLRVEHRDPRVVADPIPFLVASRNRVLLDVERVDAGLAENQLLHRRVQAGDQRHDGDDRRHGDDVPVLGHERPQLAGPDRVERDHRRFVVLVHLVCVFVSALIASPSLRLRTELYGPVMTESPTFNPLRTSKYLSPAMPILIGTNSAFPLRTANTPSVSFRVCPGLSSEAAATGSTPRGRFSSRGCFTTWPLAS